MKRFVSVLMILLVVMSFAVVSTSALESAETVVPVKSGDEVVYTLKLTTPEKVVGCDFSVYYDSTALQVKSVADFTGNYDSEEHQAVINPNIKDEVIGNWSILSGVKFDNRTVVSVKFKALKNTDTHISYYVRYLYPDSLEQFTEYKFTCDVTVNKKPVIENEAPELNVEDPQPNGLFVNSVTGDGKDADVNTSTHVPNNSNGANGGEANENDVDNNSNNTAVNNSDSKKDNKKDSDKKADKKTEETKAEKLESQTVSPATESDDADTTISSPSQTEKNDSIFASAWLWVIIGIIVVGGGVAAVLAVKIKKDSKKA